MTSTKEPKAVVDFWFEFASTYSYLAAMQIEERAARVGVTVRWKPFLLGPIFHSQGWDDSPFNLYKAKGDYMWRDLERMCATLELDFEKPSVFPRNGLMAARVACCNAESVWLPAFVRSIYQANFAHDWDVSDPAIVADCLVQVGADSEFVLADAQTPQAKVSLREQTMLAGELGLFGAPSFVVGKELFWGSDRIDDALDWALKQ